MYLCPVTRTEYDPLALRRQIILASAGKFNEAVTKSKSEDALTAAQGEETLVQVGRKVFSAKTDADALAALRQFTVWLAAKKGKVLVGRNDAPCTDCPPGR